MVRTFDLELLGAAALAIAVAAFVLVGCALAYRELERRGEARARRELEERERLLRETHSGPLPVIRPRAESDLFSSPGGR